MEHEVLTAAVPKFVQQVVQAHNGRNRILTVNDLRLGIRSARMSETSEWSERELDLVEVHAARFDGGAPLDHVLDLSLPGGLDALSVTTICAPSPFAWM
jgi:hypothetical protein